MISSLHTMIFSFTAAVSSFAVSVALAVYGAVLLKRQIRLYRSIRLVELKSSKIKYWVFAAAAVLAEFYLITQIFDPAAPEAVLLQGGFGLTEWQYNLALSSVAVMIAVLIFYLLILAFSKSAVVDRGVYCGSRFLDWYHVHDYLIDESKGVVVLSANKYTFQTLMATTPPMKVAKNDIPKLKFILSKNKNKFSGFVSETLWEE